jgi:hypothetical protein
LERATGKKKTGTFSSMMGHAGLSSCIQLSILIRNPGGKLVLMKSSRVAFATALIVGILLLAGCPTRTSIANINRDPGHFAGREVTIAGHVSEAFGALGNGVFQIDDGSGRMWVYSQNYGVPGNGSKVAVTGRVEQGFAFGGRSFGVVLRETERRH